MLVFSCVEKATPEVRIIALAFLATVLVTPLIVMMKLENASLANITPLVRPMVPFFPLLYKFVKMIIILV